MSLVGYPRLWQMFGGYFHQDWDKEGTDWPDVVGNFAKGRPQSELDATAAELDRLVADFPDDAPLERELFCELHCSYAPRPDLGGPSVRVWLAEITAFLRAGARPDEPGSTSDWGSSTAS
jgi:hypothetical protein